MNRKLLNHKMLLLVVLLACLALPLGHLAAQDSATADPSAPDAADFLPDEPNDTFATAIPLRDLVTMEDYDPLGYFHTPADVDFYTFGSNEALADIYIVSPYYDYTTTLRVEAAVFDMAHNLVYEDASCNDESIDFYGANIPAGDYFLRVRPCAGTHDADQPYEVAGEFLRPTDVLEDEPNNTMAQATPIEYGQWVGGVYETNGDTCASDWFRFEGRAGDTLRFLDFRNYDEQVGLGYLYDAAGNYLPETLVLPADGTYYLKLLALDPDWLDCYSGDYRFRLGEESLWVSAAVNALGGNTAIKSGDIVTRKTAANQWAIVFDASDVGITKNVVAFDRMPDGSLLLTLGAAQNVPGLGKVMPQDIIRFVPTSLGANTAGTFEWVLDGSDVGLTTTGEKIDALYWRWDVQNPLYLSLAGAGSLPRQSGGNLTVADEDVINFVAAQYGSATTGKWRMDFDGSTRPGLAAEDVNALERIDQNPERLSFAIITLTGAFNLGGQTGGPLDVLGLEAGNGPAPFRLTDKPIDGLAVGPAWTE